MCRKTELPECFSCCSRTASEQVPNPAADLVLTGKERAHSEKPSSYNWWEGGWAPDLISFSFSIPFFLPTCQVHRLSLSRCLAASALSLCLSESCRGRCLLAARRCEEARQLPGHFMPCLTADICRAQVLYGGRLWTLTSRWKAIHQQHFASKACKTCKIFGLKMYFSGSSVRVHPPYQTTRLSTKKTDRLRVQGAERPWHDKVGGGASRSEEDKTCEIIYVQR